MSIQGKPPIPQPPRLQVLSNIQLNGVFVTGLTFNIRLTCTKSTDPDLGGISVTAITSSNGDYTFLGLALPIAIAQGAGVNLSVKLTPLGAGEDDTVISITWNGITTLITVQALVMSGSGPVVAFVAGINGEQVGVAEPTKVGVLTGFGMFPTNTGNADYHITALTIDTQSDAGAFKFDVTSPVVPILVAAGATGPEILFTYLPDLIGNNTAVLEVTTDSLTQPTLKVPLSGLSLVTIPVGVLSGSERDVLLAFDNLLILKSDYNNPDLDSDVAFNGTLWNSIGNEKVLRRVQVYYLNLGVCTGLTCTVAVWRPSLNPPQYDDKSFTIAGIGDAQADGNERSSFFDIQLAGEIIIMVIKKAKGSGPVGIIGFLPEFEEKGEKVEGN